MTNEDLKKNIEIILNTAHLLGSELTKKNIFEQFETAITKAREEGFNQGLEAAARVMKMAIEESQKK